jgi:hypothetical protein
MEQVLQVLCSQEGCNLHITGSQQPVSFKLACTLYAYGCMCTSHLLGRQHWVRSKCLEIGRLPTLQQPRWDSSCQYVSSVAGCLGANMGARCRSPSAHLCCMQPGRLLGGTSSEASRSQPPDRQQGWGPHTVRAVKLRHINLRCL